MRIFLYALLEMSVVVFSFVSCSSYLDTSPDIEKSHRILFTVKSQSLSGQETEQDVFKIGDEIGLFVTARTNEDTPVYPTNDNCIGTNLKFVMKETGWTPVDENNVIVWDETGIVYDFFAYFPYIENADPSAIIGSISPNQSGLADYHRSDFMIAANTEGKTNTKVELLFKHVLSRMDIELAPETVSNVNSGLVNNAIKSYSVSLTDQTAVKGEESDKENIQMYQTGQNTFSVLLPPQKFEAGSTIFTFSIGSKSYAVKYDTEVELLSGNVSRHKINIPN